MIWEKLFYYGYLQCTEPLRPKKILDKCFLNLLKNKKLDSSFAGYELQKIFGKKKKNNTIKRISNINQRNVPRQKKYPVLIEDTGVALASKSSVFYIYQKERIGKKIKIVPYNSLGGLVDIHTLKDLKLAEQIMKN